MFTKATLKKQFEIDEDGFPMEVLDLRLQYAVSPKDTMEDVRSARLQMVDRKVNGLFEAEMEIMPRRLEEGETWVQQGLFSEEVMAAARRLKNTIERIGGRAEFSGQPADDYEG